ncbi:hypothetical protein [Mycobacterium interjectum]|uniref:hypothetical protein n=1 Tax=Mycobacterium interjectum TaxID=33895 RepID=UPI000A5A1E8F|nr:hypothetical protein [Mycobacterium interjectum]MCV7089502.1 hypothetical protein [Mycobacterium interjectum]
MVSADNGLQAEPDLEVWGAEDALRAGQRAEHAWLLARAAQRSAANSLDHSAASHERTADVYDEAAERNNPGAGEYRQHAARHREFAQEDRLMAQRLRQMADAGPMGLTDL